MNGGINLMRRAGPCPSITGGIIPRCETDENRWACLDATAAANVTFVASLPFVKTFPGLFASFSDLEEMAD